jgi:hypothetical protein
MSRTIFCPISIVIIGLAFSLKAAPTPTPTPKPSFFRTRVYRPASTPSSGSAAVGRGTHLGVDRSAQTPTPKPTATSKSKSSRPAARKSPTPSATPSKAAKSPTPAVTATPHATPSPQKEISPEEVLSPTPSTPVESVSPTPTPTPSPAATSTPKPTPTATATPTPTAKPTSTPKASASPTSSPVSRPTKMELTLTKFEPPHGSHGGPDYRSAQLSYRINAPNRMEYPTIEFTVETTSGKLFERVARLPAGSAFVEPGDDTEHTVALDPVERDDWADAYAKTDRAMFKWSIVGGASGEVENSVKKSWP